MIDAYLISVYIKSLRAFKRGGYADLSYGKIEFRSLKNSSQGSAYKKIATDIRELNL